VNVIRVLPPVDSQISENVSVEYYEENRKKNELWFFLTKTVELQPGKLWTANRVDYARYHTLVQAP